VNIIVMIYDEEYLSYRSIVYRNIKSIAVEYQVIVECIYWVSFGIYNDRIKEFIVLIYDIY
jgi:hypothetical protein